jgi:hypothetical protein
MHDIVLYVLLCLVPTYIAHKLLPKEQISSSSHAFDIVLYVLLVPTYISSYATSQGTDLFLLIPCI